MTLADADSMDLHLLEQGRDLPFSAMAVSRNCLNNMAVALRIPHSQGYPSYMRPGHYLNSEVTLLLIWTSCLLCFAAAQLFDVEGLEFLVEDCPSDSDLFPFFHYTMVGNCNSKRSRVTLEGDHLCSWAWTYRTVVWRT